jgi:hypothetical protein
MSKPPDIVEELSNTLSLCEYQSPRNGCHGFWLYDGTRGMNLAMRAKTEREAFVKALTYYQGRLADVEQEYKSLTAKVEAFVSQVTAEQE